MAIPIKVPRLGWTMEEGVFIEWLKPEGATIAPGDPLFVLEGEKAAQEIESFDGGILRLPPDAPRPGQTLPVGAVLGYLLEPGETAPWEGAGVGSQESGAGEPTRCAGAPALTPRLSVCPSSCEAMPSMAIGGRQPPVDHVTTDQANGTNGK